MGRTPENLVNPSSGYFEILDLAEGEVALGPSESGYMVSTYNSTATGTQGDPHIITIPETEIGLRYFFMLPGNKYVSLRCGNGGDAIDVNSDLYGASLLGIPNGQTCILELECVSLNSWRVSHCVGTIYMDDNTALVYSTGHVSGATEDNFPMFDANGTLKDSGMGIGDVQKTFDVRGGSKHVTGSAAATGGTVTGSITLGVIVGTVSALRVKANGNTVDSTIEFFADAARSDRLYLASNKDCYTSPYFEDRTAWACLSFANDLEDSKIYYQITNDGANASTYDVELFGLGKE